MKQTAVEWLIEKLSYSTSDGTIISHHFIINKLVEQAKAMEKEQMKYFIQVGYYAHSQGHKKNEELYNYWIDNYNK
jgi:hypothetical protein